MVHYIEWNAYVNYITVREWCYASSSCATKKSPTQLRRGALQNIKAGYPVHIIATDIVGPLPTSSLENR